MSKSLGRGDAAVVSKYRAKLAKWGPSSRLSGGDGQKREVEFAAKAVPVRKILRTQLIGVTALDFGG